MRTGLLVAIAVLGIAGSLALGKRRPLRSVLSRSAIGSQAPPPPRSSTLWPLLTPTKPPSVDARRAAAISDLTLDDDVRRGLAKLSAQQRILFDYKLDLLKSLESCAAARLRSNGVVSLSLDFQVSPGGTEARGTAAELEDSSFTEEEDRVLEDCANDLHKEIVIKLSPAIRESHFHWITSIHWPIDDDSVYQFLRSGEWPTNAVASQNTPAG